MGLLDVELKCQRMEIGNRPFGAENYDSSANYLFLISIIKNLKGWHTSPVLIKYTTKVCTLYEVFQSLLFSTHQHLEILLTLPVFLL